MTQVPDPQKGTKKLCVVIAYDAPDIEIAEAFRDVLCGLGPAGKASEPIGVYVDNYAKPGEAFAHGVDRYMSRMSANVLVVINPRPDSKRVEPAQAIRDFADLQDGSGQILVALANQVRIDESVAKAIDDAQKKGIRCSVLRQNLEVLSQHHAASLVSMEDVAMQCALELGVSFRSVSDPLNRLRHGWWTKFRYSRAGIIAALVVGGVFGILHIAGASHEGFNAIRSWSHALIGWPAVHVEAGDTSSSFLTPAMTAKYTNSANFSVPVAPGRVPPRVGQTISIVSDRPVDLRDTFLVCLQPGPMVSALQVHAENDEYRKPWNFLVDKSGVYTALAVSYPKGRASVAVIEQQLRSVLSVSEPVLEPGVWLAWDQADYQYAFPDGTKGTPMLSKDLAPQDAWATGIKAALLRLGADDQDVRFNGWSLTIKDAADESALNGGER